MCAIASRSALSSLLPPNRLDRNPMNTAPLNTWLNHCKISLKRRIPGFLKPMRMACSSM